MKADVLIIEAGCVNRLSIHRFMEANPLSESEDEYRERRPKKEAASCDNDHFDFSAKQSICIPLKHAVLYSAYLTVSISLSLVCSLYSRCNVMRRAGVLSSNLNMPAQSRRTSRLSLISTVERAGSPNSRNEEYGTR